MADSSYGKLTAVRIKRAGAESRCLRRGGFFPLAGLAAALSIGCGDPKPPRPTEVKAPEVKSGGQADTADLPTIYKRVRTRFDHEPDLATGEEFAAVRDDLRKVINGADDLALRANASLLLGALYEERKEPGKAVDFYRGASKYVPDDAGPHMALALALRAAGEHEEAATVQQKAAELDPDNLENWLNLGQMRLKVGDSDGAIKAYLDYERRRKGLIDGLTLKKDGAYLIAIDDRIGCAEALASANDQGTGNAMVFALKSEPEARVREAIVRVMGLQRLAMYKPALEAARDKETDDVRDAITWALAEIARDPVEAQATLVPAEAGAAVEGTAPAGG